MLGGGISEPFIRRPIGTSLLMVAVMIVGVIAYRSLPVSSLPRIDFPTFQVTALLPGADPETMAASVAAPLERRFGQIAGVSELTSVCGTGVASVTIQFSLDRTTDAAARDIQAAITSSRSELPLNLPNPPIWRKTSPADAPIMIMALTSETQTPDKVYAAASTILVQRICQVDGLAQVTIAGAQKSAVRVQVNPTALAHMGLGMEDVRVTLAAANARGPKGRVDGNEVAYSIGADDQLMKAEDYKPLVVRSKNGSLVRISDVAQVADGVVDVRQIAWYNGKRAVLLLLYKQPNANVIETVDAVKALLPQLQKWIPASIELHMVSDRTTTIRASVADVQFTLLITIGLVIAIVFLFLGRFWSTFAAASTVPLSLAGTFAGMYACGYNIDNLSLMAITVAVGFVVDDAIVMIENISRRHELGDKPLAAAITGARQINFTVISISISLVAVFIPLLFMRGLVGRMFREFAVTLSMAIGISALVSLTATPMICAYLAKDISGHGKDAQRNWIERFSDLFFKLILRFYARTLDVVIAHRFIMLFVTLATIAFTVYLYTIVPRGFFPQQDSRRIQVTTEAPADISFVGMSERQRLLSKLILENPNVRSLMSSVGASGYNAVTNQGSMFIELKPREFGMGSTDDVAAQLKKAAATVRGITFNPRPVQDITAGGRRTKLPYQYTLSAVDISEINDFAPKLLAKLKTLKELDGVNTDQTVGALETRIDIDRDAAARYGITPTDIDAALYNAFGQRQVSIIYTDIDQYRVVLEARPDLLQDPTSLEKVYVKAPQSGLQIPLRNLAKFKTGTLPLSVTHQGQFPAVTISFALAAGVPLGAAAEKIEAATRELNPPETLRAAFQGTAQMFQDTSSTMPLLILTSLLAIYIILGVLYESLIHPITILSTIPSAGIGALLALMAFGYPLDVISLIGIILLIGIVKKNAIMMIDFAIEAERDHAKSPQAAIREACLLRFRPITMTTMAALLGALPLALGQGVGSELRRPLGVAIVGGLLMSQVLTLYTTPVIYIFLDGLRKYDKSKFWRLLKLLFWFGVLLSVLTGIYTIYFIGKK